MVSVYLSRRTKIVPTINQLKKAPTIPHAHARRKYYESSKAGFRRGRLLLIQLHQQFLLLFEWNLLEKCSLLLIAHHGRIFHRALRNVQFKQLKHQLLKFKHYAIGTV